MSPSNNQRPEDHGIAIPGVVVTQAKMGVGDAKPPNHEMQISELLLRIEELEAALKAAYTDPQFSILTRSGLDHRWHQRPASGHEDTDTVIFFDIDHIHRRNEQWGYAGTDAHIRAVMSQIDYIWLFRWFSGDEFGMVCAGADAQGFAARVKRLLQAEGMTATFGIAPISGNDLKASMADAAALVQTAKA
jgi:GGDEF domain-containing protein